MTSPDQVRVPRPEAVVVADIRMPFASMVVFMVKWSIAAIPAVLILVLCVTFAASLSSALLTLTPSERARARHAEAVAEYERDQEAFLDSLRRAARPQQ